MKARLFCMAWILASALMGCDGGDGNNNSGGSGGEGGAGASGGSGGSGGSGATGTGGSAECPSQASGTAANHIIVKISWPETIGLEAGEGEMHIWTKASLTFNGNDVTGTAEPCGSVIPELIKTSLAGGGKVQTVIPDEVWDAATMPAFDVQGAISGFNVGATISMDPIASTVGLTMTDPANDPWPAEASQVMTADHDGDGKPGIKAIPRTDGELTAPPLDLNGALDPNGPRADEVYVVTRTKIQLEGTRDSCTSAKGTAKVTNIDSHVVGCHVKGGSDCTQDQSDFIDANQPKYTILSATYEMVQVPADATCADVRAALPMQ
ncbi:MAG: hypothetical protein IPK82_22745 [Polyangiaceae bacterium]|nr:hypothetical protein [Polyangiaceae bacterium]